MTPPEADWRLWLVRLDDAFEGKLPRGERRYAKKEAKGAIEDLAFRFAFLDDRFAPDEKDYARALAAVKPPPEAAEVLARRRPIYKRKHLAAVLRGWTILALLLLAGFGVSQFAGTETAVPLATFTYGNATAETGTVIFRPIVVPDGLDRIDVTVHATGLAETGSVSVRLLHPSSEIAYERTFTRDSRLYDHANLPPVKGTWFAVVDFVDARGAVRVDVVGVRAS